jgi:hypothetical protein
MNQYKISEKTINDVLSYLGKCPYMEVVNHIIALQKVEKIEEENAKIAKIVK